MHRRLLCLVSLLLICFAVHCKKTINKRFVNFLKAEQLMRDRISDPIQLRDSLEILQQKYRIDREKEITYLKDHPEQWVILLKALRNESQD